MPKMSMITSSMANIALQDNSVPSFPTRRGSWTSISTLTARPSSSSDDPDDLTVTMKRVPAGARPSLLNQRNSAEDLRLLALSAQLTEISYNVSDLQTRIFEIQELRHQAVIAILPESSSSIAAPTSAIDHALMNLDERLESVSKSIEALELSFESLSPVSCSPTEHTPNSDVDIARKRQEMMEEWDSVQKESEELRKELADDKWLVVFRTVTEQADNMMASLEKILAQCQEFMWQSQRKNVSDMFTERLGTLIEPPPVDYEHYLSLANNLDAKKTYYIPSITKILGILDKGINEHTKNGECLRRHADSRARWKTLRDRIGRVDTQMETTRRALANSTDDAKSSEGGSTISRDHMEYSISSKKSNIAHLQVTSADSAWKSRSPSALSLSRSISPFRKLASRMSQSMAPGRTPPNIRVKKAATPSSDPAQSVRNRASLFFGKSSPVTTPDKVRHSHSQSVQSPSSNDASSPRGSVDTPTRPKTKWNGSTKVDDNADRSGTIRPPRPPRRPSMGTNLFNASPTAPPVPALPPRSVSRCSIGSSRPWSPVASGSTLSTRSSQISSSRPSISRPVSRQTDYGVLRTPRPRPKTPSNIPTPGIGRSVSAPYAASDAGDFGDRGFSPTFSASGRRSVMTERSQTPSRIPTPRTPSGKYGNIPRLDLPRPSSSLSRRYGAQTPESSIRATALQVPAYRGAHTPRPSLVRGPPSSFRGDARTTDRRFTPSAESDVIRKYTPNHKDPLDIEVAKTVNGIAHGFLIERIDPPLRTAPPAGQELKAQYAISNSLSRKIINCRLVVIKRSTSSSLKEEGDGTIRKVMCRVGGGWLDLHMYLLNHQTGTSGLH